MDCSQRAARDELLTQTGPLLMAKLLTMGC